MRFVRGKAGASGRSGPRGGLLLPDREAHYMEGKERALQPHRAQGDAEFLHEGVVSQRLRLGQREALQHRGEHRSAGLTDRASASFEPHLGDALGAVDLQMEGDLVATKGVRVPRAERGPGKGPFVLRMLVVVQDLLLVQVGGRGRQAKTSCTFLMPATRTSTSSRSL